jgi:hypothetical protein
MRGHMEGECGEKIPRIVGADAKHLARCELQLDSVEGPHVVHSPSGDLADSPSLHPPISHFTDGRHIFQHDLPVRPAEEKRSNDLSSVHRDLQATEHENNAEQRDPESDHTDCGYGRHLGVGGRDRNSDYRTHQEGGYQEEPPLGVPILHTVSMSHD